MKIFDANQMREWDAYTIQEQNIISTDLMERAALACSNWIHGKNFNPNKIQVVCGKGNNGVDGLAIARFLKGLGYKPLVFIADWDEKESHNFRENRIRLENSGTPVHFLQDESTFTVIKNDSIIVDALFGYGLNRSIEGSYAGLINHINTLTATIISIDIPSGMFMDKTSKGNPVIKASYTLTFQSMKLCFLMAENADYFGEVHVLPIGLSQEFGDKTEARFMFTDINVASSIYKKRKQFSHKGTYGHALLLAGSEEKMGAAVMCAKSCLRSGVGLLTCLLTRNTFSIMHITNAEAMVMERGKEKNITNYSVIGAGPGLGTEDDIATLLHSFLDGFGKPMVLDADALNIISTNDSWKNKIPKSSILTPHPKEFDRLWPGSNNDWERMEKAIQAAKTLNIIIVLKGTYTLVTDGVRNYFNSSGNNGLATGGSGDILTGLVTGLLSQKYLPFEAAVTGVYIHGLAADISLAKQSYESLLPSDVTENFGEAFKTLQKNKGA